MPRVAIALALALLVAAVEYFFRHFVLFWMPTLGRLNVNDMVSLALAYTLLVLVVGWASHADWRHEAHGLAAALRELATRWTFMPWILGAILCLAALSVVDAWLWGDVRLPMWVSHYRNPAVWLASWGAVLNAFAVMGVNAIVVPVAEEYLWRANVQRRLQAVLPAAAAIAITAVLFSLKHVLVDASPARFLTLAAFGAICGAVAWRHTWRHAAALHLFVNAVTSAVVLARS